MKNINLFLLLLFLLPIFMETAHAEEKTRVACVGNSITFGAGIKDKLKNSYPAVLGQLLGDKWDVRNFGVSARTLLKKGNYPYWNEQAFTDAKAFDPHIVLIKLGTNDTKPYNWKYRKEFKKDLIDLIESFENLPTRPKIYLCTPIFVSKTNGEITEEVLEKGVIPIIRKVAKEKNLDLIDLHDITAGRHELYCDGIHPNETGARFLAGHIYTVLTGKEPTTTIAPFPGRKSDWNGFDRYDFAFSGRQATVVVPHRARPDRAWIWRPAFFGHEPQVDLALLENGFHVAYFDVTHCYGSPTAVKQGFDFYNYLLETGSLSPTVTLEGLSRGGLYALNWASTYPDKVACIYVDAPVCNLQSWPGPKSELWQDFLNEWKLTTADGERFNENPIDRLAPLAKANIPVLSVCGEADDVVPYTENTRIAHRRYEVLGGNMRVILKPGVNHHPHSLKQPEPIVDFILQNQPAYRTKMHIHFRSDMMNARLKFARDKQATVAFLGGSITEMEGWRNRICESLKQRFPETRFTFIDAGIASTGSTPGAFRLHNDILSKGKVDLLFMEAAVNDDTNGFSPEEQIKGEEGIIRHALRNNPDMDIVMLHFIYDPFIRPLQEGQTPEVILNHEKVARHYGINSIDLAQEVAERMAAGEFDWQTFGGTHPAPFGHKIYAAAIDRLFDQAWNIPYTFADTVRPHTLPDKLDRNAYEKGHFVDLKTAQIDKDWTLSENWTPKTTASTRKGFVHVPMLHSSTPGAELKLTFTGSAVGIFCVAGPDAGIVEYKVDNGSYRQLDTYTEWSKYLYIPWVYMFEKNLSNGPHTLYLKISADKNNASTGTGCYIRNFVVNGPNDEIIQTGSPKR